MTTTTVAVAGHDLREAREAAGLTRTWLAARIGCSLAHLANIEQGCVPHRGDVLDRAWAALAATENDDDPEANRAVVKEGAHAAHNTV